MWQGMLAVVSIVRLLGKRIQLVGRLLGRVRSIPCKKKLNFFLSVSLLLRERSCHGFNECARQSASWNALNQTSCLREPL